MRVPMRCTSNKLDEVKDTRSLNLNAAIIVKGERIAKGTNMNINNLSISDYNALCAELGVKEITKTTPIIADFEVASIKADAEEWAGTWDKADSDE